MSCNKVMKIGIYDPYLDTLGGGERYVLTVAEYFLSEGHSVDIFWSGRPAVVDQAATRFNLKLSGLKVVPDVFKISPRHLELMEDLTSPISSAPSPSTLLKVKDFLNKLNITRAYDVIFYLSDGSLPFLLCRRKLIHFQVPFSFTTSLPKSIINRLKLLGSSCLVINSQFTANFVKKLFKAPYRVVFPPVDIDKFKPSVKKENLILSVGRFDNILNAKRQDVLIDMFSKFLKAHPNLKWRLVLAGGSLSDPLTNSYLKLLQTKSKALPIEFMVNPDFNSLVDIYSRSSIYWHAAGFEVDQNLHPENTEHFGIVVVEAMASGCVPVVINAGGIPEIVTHGQNGYLWTTLDQAVDYTAQLAANPTLTKQLSANALASAARFSKAIFYSQLKSLING